VDNGSQQGCSPPLKPIVKRFEILSILNDTSCGIVVTPNVERKTAEGRRAVGLDDELVL